MEAAPPQQADLCSPPDVIERLELLRQQDWDRITMQLLRYAGARFLALGIPVLAGAVRGVSIGDLVQNAIEAVWSTDQMGGRHREWNHREVSLATFLRNAVRSEVSNLLNLAEVAQVSAWPDAGGDEGDDPPEDAMQQRYADPSHDHARHLPRPSRTPEELVADQEEVEECHDLFLEAAGDDEELVRYLDTIDRGVEEPAMIAQEWGVEPKIIYNVENRLRRRVAKLFAARRAGARPPEEAKR